LKAWKSGINCFVGNLLKMAPLTKPVNKNGPNSSEPPTCLPEGKTRGKGFALRAIPIDKRRIPPSSSGSGDGSDRSSKSSKSSTDSESSSTSSSDTDDKYPVPKHNQKIPVRSTVMNCTGIRTRVQPKILDDPNWRREKTNEMKKPKCTRYGSCDRYVRPSSSTCKRYKSPASSRIRRSYSGNASPTRPSYQRKYRSRSSDDTSRWSEPSRTRAEHWRSRSEPSTSKYRKWKE